MLLVNKERAAEAREQTVRQFEDWSKDEARARERFRLLLALLWWETLSLKRSTRKHTL